MSNISKQKIWWDDKEKIARAKAFDIIDEATAEKILAMASRIGEEHGPRVDWIIDLSELIRATAKARKILAEVTAHPSIRKYALVGASIFLRTVANFIIAASGQKNARHFATEDEAIAWIRKGK